MVRNSYLAMCLARHELTLIVIHGIGGQCCHSCITIIASVMIITYIHACGCLFVVMSWDVLKR